MLCEEAAGLQSAWEGLAVEVDGWRELAADELCLGQELREVLWWWACCRAGRSGRRE